MVRSAGSGQVSLPGSISDPTVASERSLRGLWGLLCFVFNLGNEMLMKMKGYLD